MDDISNDEYFNNRQQVMHIINCLMANEQYGRHAVMDGRNGVLAYDIANVLATIVGMEDNLEGIEGTVNGIITELLKQHLLKSTGEGSVMNPHPPLGLDTHVVDDIIGRTLDTIEAEKLAKKAKKKIKDDERKAKKAEMEALEQEMKALEEAAKGKKADEVPEENVENTDDVDEDDALE